MPNLGSAHAAMLPNSASCRARSCTSGLGECTTADWHCTVSVLMSRTPDGGAAQEMHDSYTYLVGHEIFWSSHADRIAVDVLQHSIYQFLMAECSMLDLPL